MVHALVRAALAPDRQIDHLRQMHRLPPGALRDLLGRGGDAAILGA